MPVDGCTFYNQENFRKTTIKFISVMMCSTLPKITPAIILARTCEVINASGWLYFFIIKKISAKLQLNLFQS